MTKPLDETLIDGLTSITRFTLKRLEEGLRSGELGAREQVQLHQAIKIGRTTIADARKDVDRKSRVKKEPTLKGMDGKKWTLKEVKKLLKTTEPTAGETKGEAVQLS